MTRISLYYVFVLLARLHAYKVYLGSSLSGRCLSAESKANLKLPVWPVWGGVLAQFSDWAGNRKLTESILSLVGGRVVPMTLGDEQVSPFLLLAHHTHSFTPFDPIRFLTKLVLPEGFPAHPHSGFDTVTYCIDGGLVHRDSEGLKMAYGNGDIQWMRAGRGIIHEEMWDVFQKPYSHQKIEIFQLWVNLPRSSKYDQPKSLLLKSSEIPVWRESNDAIIRVISGSLIANGSALVGPGSTIAASPVGILHITLASNCYYPLSIPSGSSIAAYVRKGSLCFTQDSKDSCGESGDILYYRDNTIEKGTTEEVQVDITLPLLSGPDGADILLLLGIPLGEPVVWGGPLVHANEEDYTRSARAFNTIGRESFWDYNLKDEEWYQHVQKLKLQEKINAFVPEQ